MAKTLSQIHSMIDKLKKQAASIESGVVARIKKEIAQHGLTIEHLFGSSASAAGKGPAAEKPASTSSKTRATYADSNGNSWSGFGPRPAWLKEAVDGGASLDSFLVGAAGSRNDPAAPKLAAKKVAKKATSVRPAKFADDKGNSWHGMGMHPGWIREAIASGASLDDFRIGKKKSAAAKEPRNPEGASAVNATAKSARAAKVPKKVGKSAKAATTVAVKTGAAAVSKSAAKAEIAPKSPTPQKVTAKKGTKSAAIVAKKPATKKSAAKASSAASPVKAAASAASTKKSPSKKAVSATAAAVDASTAAPTA